MRPFAFLFVTLITCSCALPKPEFESPEFRSATPSPTTTPELPTESRPYDGKTIDEIFPLITGRDFTNQELKGKKFEVEAAQYTVVIDDFKPREIRAGKQTLMRLPTRKAGNYWSSLVGTANLVRPSSEQIYVVASGPGAVCCTNYWIVDVTGSKPHLIFRSEDFGDFRDPMEIFDGDGDGVYELVQFDSCMRYFRDDCGSCSPEPRAYFKYDPKNEKYLPGKNVVQSFVEESLAKTAASLDEDLHKYKATKDPSIGLDLRREALSYIAQLLHLGKTRQAWAAFTLYELQAEDRKEILRRLSSCKFYQYLNRH